MPFLASVSARQGGFVLANAAKLPAPTFSASSGTSGGYTFTISNYDATVTYSFSVNNGGSATQTSGNVTVTGLGNNITATCIVTVNKNGWLTNSASTTGTSFSQLAAPTFGVSSGTAGGYTFTISNYSASNTYSFSVTNGGSATQVSGTVTVTGLGNAITATCTVTSSRSGFTSNSASTTGTSFTQLDTPTLATATSEVNGFTVVINNYDAAATYSISTTNGSVSRSGSTITCSGIGNSGSALISVSATKTGFAPSATATRGGSAVPGCTYTGYSYTNISGGNCSTCGIICCGTGVPAYNFTFFQYTPYPCNLSGTKISDDPGYAGSWYCLTTGTGAGLTCGPGTICGGINGC
jgi:hypothetical protein